MDNSRNEIVVKVVNAEATPFTTTINLNGAGSLDPRGEIIMLSSETDESTFDQPLKISPRKEEFKSFGNSFDMEFKPYSLTVLRIRRK